MAEETEQSLMDLDSGAYVKQAKKLFFDTPQLPGEDYEDYNARKWEMVLGRPPRPEEMEFLGRAGVKGIEILEKSAEQILHRAQASGVEDITIQEARQLRDKYLDPSKFNLDNSYKTDFSGQLDDGSLAVAIESLGRKRYEDQIRDEIEKVTNPDISDQHKADVTSVYQDVFGRPPSQRELAGFSKELASGYLDPLGLETYLRQTPEFMESKAAKDREAINQELLSSEEEVFAKAQPQIISSYMRAGRLDSSGLQSALAKARADLASQRQGFLTGFAREDAVGARNAAFQNYLRQSEPGFQQRLNVQGAGNFMNFQQPYNNLSRQYSLADQSRARQYEVDDYNRMQNDFFRYLGSQRGNPMGGAISGALSGAGALSRFGPYGALAGGLLGGFGGYQASR